MKEKKEKFRKSGDLREKNKYKRGDVDKEERKKERKKERNID